MEKSLHMPKWKFHKKSQQTDRNLCNISPNSYWKLVCTHTIAMWWRWIMLRIGDVPTVTYGGHPSIKTLMWIRVRIRSGAGWDTPTNENWVLIILAPCRWNSSRNSVPTMVLTSGAKCHHQYCVSRRKTAREDLLGEGTSLLIFRYYCRGRYQFVLIKTIFN